MKNFKAPSTKTRGSSNSKALRLLLSSAHVLERLLVPAACVAVTLLLSTPVFADGPVFNGNASKLGQIVRAVLLLAAALVAVMGVFFAIKALKNFGNDKEWGNQTMATLGCFALTTVLAVMWALAQGTVVDVGLDF
ncbi:MAG: hypothetical protein ABW208_16715 [Pyrinomonadaceae bacterium]